MFSNSVPSACHSLKETPKGAPLVVVYTMCHRPTIESGPMAPSRSGIGYLTELPPPPSPLHPAAFAGRVAMDTRMRRPRKANADRENRLRRLAFSAGDKTISGLFVN